MKKKQQRKTRPCQKRRVRGRKNKRKTKTKENKKQQPKKKECRNEPKTNELHGVSFENKK